VINCHFNGSGEEGGRRSDDFNKDLFRSQRRRRNRRSNTLLTTSANHPPTPPSATHSFLLNPFSNPAPPTPLPPAKTSLSLPASTYFSSQFSARPSIKSTPTPRASNHLPSPPPWINSGSSASGFHTTFPFAFPLDRIGVDVGVTNTNNLQSLPPRTNSTSQSSK